MRRLLGEARRTDSGLATVWAISWMLACTLLAYVAAIIAGVVAAQHHLDGAADLAALSGAARLQRGGDACAAVGRVASANRAELVTCDLVGDDVAVEVTRRIDLPLGIDGRLTALARAGPT